MALPLFYGNEEDFQGLRQSLKHQHCPHCGCVGTLNCHGSLSGYTEAGGCARECRGHRIFCSNRHLRSGCGRTCSVLLCGCLKRFLITLKTLWAFIFAVVAGQTKKSAFTSHCPRMHHSAAYRLHRRLDREQINFRTHLRQHTPVPPPPSSTHPFADTLAHFLAAFPSSAVSPFADYQLAFQTPLL